MRRLVFAAALVLGFSFLSFAADPVTLFIIENNRSVNSVHYDLQFDDQGSVNLKNPIDSHWILGAKNNERSEITSLQKRAYGFDFKQNSQGEYILTLTAVRERPMTIRNVNGAWRAQLLINNKPAFLTKVFVNASGGFLGIPRVNSITLYGIDIVTGAAVEEIKIP